MTRKFISNDRACARLTPGRRRSTGCRWAVSCVALLLLGASTRLPADVIRLKSGGEIRGQFDGNPAANDSVDITITTLTGARVTVRRDEIEFATPRSQTVEEYETLAREIPDTVDAHGELAEWCRERRLGRQRDEQLELILLLDPDHEAARRALGYTLHGAKWMTRHEAKLADGYMRHEGRYVTQQELDLIEQTQAQLDAEQAWVEKVRLWFGWATGRHQARQAEGLQHLGEIRDPDAIPALVKHMSEHESSEVRKFFVRLLAKIGGLRPVEPLVHRSLIDTVPEIRLEALNALDETQRQAALPLYLAALRHELRLIVRRAGYALGEIGDRSVIPGLIDALVTQHRYRVSYQVQTPSYSLGSDGSIGFPSSTSGLTPEVEALARTGQLPYGAIVVPPPTGTITKTVTVKQNEQNTEVLTALKKLTAQNFGFDERTWLLWWAANESGSGPIGKLP